MHPVLSVERARQSPPVSRAIKHNPAFSLVFEGDASADQSAAGGSHDLFLAAADYGKADQFAALWVTKPVSATVPGAVSGAVAKAAWIRSAINIADAAGSNGLQSPIWVAVGAETEEFQQAAQLGAYVCTNLLGRSIEAVAKDLALYRRTWSQAGHKGQGFVTLVVPTLVGEGEAVPRAALDAMQDRLRRQPSLIREALWNFPAFLHESDASGMTPDAFLANRTREQMVELVAFAAERYLSTAALVGGFSHCRAIVEQVKEIGFDEIGCLIDFGWSTDLAREQLTALNELRLAFDACQLKNAPLNGGRPINGHADENIKSRIVGESPCAGSCRNETVKTLSDLWAELLGVAEINPDDNFFDLGGHSLLAARAASEIERTFGVRLPIKSLMIGSLGQLAAEIERQSSARPDAPAGKNASQETAPLRETAKRGRLASWFKNSRNADRFQDGSQPC